MGSKWRASVKVGKGCNKIGEVEVKGSNRDRLGGTESDGIESSGIGSIKIGGMEIEGSGEVAIDGYGIDGAENDGVENKGVELAVGGVNIGSIGRLQFRVLTAKRTAEMTE